MPSDQYWQRLYNICRQCWHTDTCATNVSHCNWCHQCRVTMFCVASFSLPCYLMFCQYLLLSSVLLLWIVCQLCCHRLSMLIVNSLHCVTNVNPRVSLASAQRTFSRGWSRHDQVETLRSQLKGQMTVSGLASAHEAGNSHSSSSPR